ncbi:MAG: hypothetical protein J5737_06345 [Bacteroidales bacterium]|nr:hypothetical protein [Bacteroidales bacterium]
MKKKLFLAVLLIAACATTAFGQISKGDPSATTIKTGNRPEAGDFGLFLGGGVYVHSGNAYMLPVLNLKYFSSDKLEWRIGIDAYRDNKKNVGVIVDGDNKSRNYNSTNVDGLFRIVPGFVHHFSNKNILDVYWGAEIPFGVDNYSATYSYDTTVYTQYRNPFSIGANLLVGLQAFIGNLPLAVGLEYGVGASASIGKQYKVEETNGYSTATYYMMEDGNFRFSSLTSNTGFIDQTVRLTLSYYFN